MPNTRAFTTFCAFLFAVTGACAAAADDAPRPTLAAFKNEVELAAALKRWQLEVRRRQAATRRALGGVMASAAPTASAAAESVTNVQHAGVDEGGIVKLAGDHLVILRRGRLFTVRIGDGALQPVAAVDAYGPGIDPSNTWYDELLVVGSTAVVIGYSYARGGTEIGLFDIASDGRIAYRATYHLRSNDYYSSRNYASRLIGNTLVFYTPLYLDPHAADPLSALPALRKWRAGAKAEDFRRIAPATRIYRTDDPLDPHDALALHSVTACDLAAAEFDCRSTAVLGPAGRVFYVSPQAVYVWATPWGPGSQRPSASSLFRLPLDGGAPQALKVAGSPIDQFSFLEDARGHLNVLVRSEGRGDAMWAAEHGAGELALLRVPLAAFSDGRTAAPARAYRALPTPRDGALVNRFVGDYLLYGVGSGWRQPRPGMRSDLYAVRYADFGGAFTLPLAHGIDRIEALGAHALAVGSDGNDLHFTSVRLAARPSVAGSYVRADAAQGETRSHGFFYRADAEDAGVLGLPVIGGGRRAARQLRRTSAAVVFVRNDALALSELGALHAAAADRDDGCKASCVDWYGNARPLFVRGRVFALLGYEIVEGALAERRIVEVRRIGFAPAP
jgi:hypothetical protein